MYNYPVDFSINTRVRRVPSNWEKIELEYAGHWQLSVLGIGNAVDLHPNPSIFVKI